MELAAVSIFVTVAVAGATELVKALFDKEYRTAVIITVAALIGAVAGMFGIDGLTVPTGIVAGLAASGIVTIAQKFGSK